VVTAIVTWFLLIATIGAWWLLYQRENRKRDAQADMDARSTQMTESFVGLDLTDKQDKAFRYSW
jgi:cbb3-type cytochrome oxidase subunit 3